VGVGAPYTFASRNEAEADAEADAGALDVGVPLNDDDDASADDGVWGGDDAQPALMLLGESGSIVVL